MARPSVLTTSRSSPDIEKWLKRPDSMNSNIDEDKSKWLFVSEAAMSSMDVDGDDDDIAVDEDNDLAQWLLVPRL